MTDPDDVNALKDALGADLAEYLAELRDYCETLPPEEALAPMVMS